MHFLSFAFQLDLSDLVGVRTFFLCLLALTPLLNTLTRVFCDPSLLNKIRFWRPASQSVDSFMEVSKPNSELMESLIAGNQGPVFPKRSRLSGAVYDRLTQIETLNNLLSTFTGICLLMDEVYNIFRDNMLSTDIVELLAASDFMSQEVYNKKFSRIYKLDDLAKRFPKDMNPAFAFPPELEKNV